MKGIAIMVLLVFCFLLMGVTDNHAVCLKEQKEAIALLGKQVTMLNARMRDLETHNHQPFTVQPRERLEQGT